MTENEKIELFDKWYDENYDEWAEGEEGIALREELEQAFKGGIEDLEKENAELKGLKDVATLIRANNDTVTTLMQLNNMLVSKNQQLTKAKDHIKTLLDCLQQDTNDPQTNYYVVKYMTEAEQFLSEVEK